MTAAGRHFTRRGFQGRGFFLTFPAPSYGEEGGIKERPVFRRREENVFS